jgi:Cyclic nucleotide-binding domain
MSPSYHQLKAVIGRHNSDIFSKLVERIAPFETITGVCDVSHMAMFVFWVKKNGGEIVPEKLSNIKPSSCRTAFQASSELFAALDAIASELHARAGDCVFTEGTIATGVYLLRSGSIRAVSAHKDGRDIVNRVIGPGAILGFPSAMCSQTFQYSVRAIEDSKLGFVETRKLNEHLRLLPNLCMQVVGMMSDELIELRETRDHMRNCANTSCSLHGSCSCAP